MKKEKLKKLISKGKLHYVLWNGVFVWGVTTAVLFSLIQHFISNKPFTENIWISLIMFPISGIIFGLVMWSKINKQYTKITSN